MGLRTLLGSLLSMAIKININGIRKYKGARKTVAVKSRIVVRNNYLDYMLYNSSKLKYNRYYWNAATAYHTI